MKGRKCKHETRTRMEYELKNYVNNNQIPQGDCNYRRMWQTAHPEYKLTQDDLIHHINGINYDNRIENLKRVTAKEHVRLHRILDIFDQFLE
jgi:hypothetical protein